MKHLVFLVAWLLVTLAAGIALADDRPNVVILLLDDAGNADFSYSARLNHVPLAAPPTVNIDRIAAEGVAANDFHLTSYCTPSRAEILTGNYPSRYGLNNALAWNSKARLDPTTTMLPTTLAANGYRTVHIGKWHLGQYQPPFDYTFGFYSGQLDYYTHRNTGGELDWYRNGLLIPGVEYSTAAFTREALGQIYDDGRPFFLYLAYQAVHVPFPKNKTYNQLLMDADASIGAVMAKIRTLPRSTIVFVMSDNGGGAAHNKPWRGAKGSVYEGGQRVPMVAWWPEHLQPRATGGALWGGDLFPTILALVGIPAPATFDGRDVSQFLLGQTALAPRRLFFFNGSNQYAVRDGQWKFDLIAGVPALYDIWHDQGETTNKAGALPGVAVTERAALAAWKPTVGLR